ncbi:MAG: DUF2934 domain-containing protein [Desulfobacterales bacterium]
MEYLEGDQLSSVINNAIFQGNCGRLYQKLAALAHFLASLHNRTAGDWRVNHEETHDKEHADVKAQIARRANELYEQQGHQDGRADQDWEHDYTAQIAKRAYELYEQRGRQDGRADQDWEQAEREIREHEAKAEPKAPK